MKRALCATDNRFRNLSRKRISYSELIHSFSLKSVRSWLGLVEPNNILDLISLINFEIHIEFRMRQNLSFLTHSFDSHSQNETTHRILQGSIWLDHIHMNPNKTRRNIMALKMLGIPIMASNIMALR